MNQIKELLDPYKKVIQKEVKQALDTNISGISNAENTALESFHYEMLADYPNRGGKCIRGILFLLTLEAMGCTIESGLKTAAAIELNQHLLLVHDDVEDDSAQRRGYPTLHRKYNSNLAVNAGDGLFFMLWKVLCDNRGHLDSETTLDLMKEFRQMVYRTCVGQTAELWYIQSHKIHLSEEECYYIIDGKTSYYTIAAPMRLAMIMAVKDVGERETLLFPQLDRLGCYLGRAFQLMDDHLDLTSDFNGLKKQRGNDIYEGKRTLLLSHLLSHCTATERREVLSIYEKGASEKKITDIDFVIDLMQEKGSFDYSIKQIENWKQKADELLPHIGFIESQPVETLKILFNYIIYRNC